MTELVGLERHRRAASRDDGRSVATLMAMDAADAERVRKVRRKAATYPALAREALRRGDKNKSEEYWRLWHEAFQELLNDLAAR